ncbi:TPA: hypothetical protein HA278_07085 [Candidatus Woesearchaeota archaeon]|nr:hypothetical protein [archaeon]HIJ11796.1 hypothetical protein [Candidatus Woesearchaeota archaeon]
MNGIKAACRRCGTSVPYDQLKLHYEYKQMVCQGCFKGKKTLENKVKTPKPEPPKPAGWDKEDEYLEKISRQKKEQQKAQFVKIPGTDFVKCTCMKCKYQFKYNPFTKRPTCCPYCGEGIPRLKTFSML